MDIPSLFKNLVAINKKLLFLMSLLKLLYLRKLLITNY